MKPENAIEVKNITKAFKVYYDKGRTLKEMTLFKNRRRYEERKVLNGISFEVKKGEAVGLIGHNGCGKSTTLKLLTRIMYPDGGTIEMRGRVSSLIELGAGFHPDMSGRQNIYTNASIFGLTRKEIEARLDPIISFSELGDYIDNPVRTYSSGMYMRLAFAVAINVDADILLIDEILAVGDTSFQAKCFSRMKEIKAQGTTIVIVSHSLSQIEEICERSIWIHDGGIRAEGIPREVHAMYLDYMGQKHTDMSKRQEEQPHEEVVAIREAALYGAEGKIEALKTGSPASIRFSYETKTRLENPDVKISIFNASNVKCYESDTSIDQVPAFTLEGQGEIEVKLEAVTLLPGKYSVDVSILTEEKLALSIHNHIVEFQVYSDIRDSGICRLEHTWQIG